MTTTREVTGQDVTSAWRTVEKARDEVLSYAKPGAFFFDRKHFDDLTEKLKRATDEYVCAVTEWASAVLRR